MRTNYYETTDLGLAASLCVSGYPVLNLDKSNPRRVVFCFQDEEGLRQTIDKFWANQLLLPATLLLEHIRQLKARLYS
jgi:hypothetical protein